MIAIFKDKDSAIKWINHIWLSNLEISTRLITALENIECFNYIYFIDGECCNCYASVIYFTIDTDFYSGHFCPICSIYSVYPVKDENLKDFIDSLENYINIGIRT